MNGQLDHVVSSSGLFEPIDLHFARLMCRLAGHAACDELFLAAALASNVTRDEKHVCLDLNAHAGKPFEIAGKNSASPAGEVRLPTLRVWIDKLRAAPVVGAPGDYAPLILDGANRLYLYRYWMYEQQLARDITARHALPLRHLDPGTARSVLGRYRDRGIELDMFQTIAAIAAATRGFCVITGGPGTGKTFTVAIVLELLRSFYPDISIRLCAPTGKAANRLQESLQSAVSGNEGQDVETIHRLLGIGQGTSRILHTSDNPIPADVVIVDEASMVPLSLMAKLAAALPGHSAMILLGDKDQLASVEAGAVLGDICDASSLNRFTPEFCSHVTLLTGLEIPEQYKTSTGVLTDCAVELEHSHRFDRSSGIGALSAAVKEGETARCRTVLAAGGDNQISWMDMPTEEVFTRRLGEIVAAWYEPLFREPSLEAAYAWHKQFKILCAHRHGRYGTEWITAAIERILRERGMIDEGRRFYRGRPVMVVRNDYTLRLFNGDTGIVWTSEGGSPAIFFPEPGGLFRAVPPSRLPEHETAYAITVHKSQGSEFDRVVIVLPENDSPLLTRELVYTGLTRARTHVEVWATAEVFAAAVRKRYRRVSGLKDALARLE